MVYIFIKTDNTVAALGIPSVLLSKSLQCIIIKDMEDCLYPGANSCSASHSIPCPLQNKLVHYYFQHIVTHTLSPNFSSPPVISSHIYSSLNNITIRAHMFSALQTSCCHTKMRDKKVIHCKIMGPFPNQVYTPSSMSQTNCHTYSYQNTTLTHKHVYISIVMLSESRKQSKDLQSCSEHYSKIFPSHFLDSAIFIP
jgi:hypothetical protein